MTNTIKLFLIFVTAFLGANAQIDSLELNYLYRIHDFEIINNYYKVSQHVSKSVIEEDSILFDAHKYLENLKFSKEKLGFEDTVELVIASRTLKHYDEKSIYNIKDTALVRLIWFNENFQKIIGVDLGEKNNFQYSLNLKIGNGQHSRKGDLILKKEISLPKRKYKKLTKKLKTWNIDFADMYCDKEKEIEFIIPDLIIERVYKNISDILILNKCKLYKDRKYRWILRFFKRVEKLAKKQTTRSLSQATPNSPSFATRMCEKGFCKA